MFLQQDIFQRSHRLLGEATMQKISAARVIIFGVGGVGSWCAESLVRSGVTRLTIVDPDTVCVSNINRQLMATTATVGEAKVEVLKDRLTAINPQAEITALQQRYDAQTWRSFYLDDYDYIIDAIDSLSDKVHLILAATATSAVFFSSMGAALKLSAARVAVTEFGKVQACPLAAALRRKIKKEGCFPAKKFLCVYSPEVLENKGETTEHSSNDSRQINGSLVHITAIFGFTLAGLVIEDLCREN